MWRLAGREAARHFTKELGTYGLEDILNLPKYHAFFRYGVPVNTTWIAALPLGPVIGDMRPLTRDL